MCVRLSRLPSNHQQQCGVFLVDLKTNNIPIVVRTVYGGVNNDRIPPNEREWEMCAHFAGRNKEICPQNITLSLSSSPCFRHTDYPTHTHPFFLARVSQTWLFDAAHWLYMYYVHDVLMPFPNTLQKTRVSGEQTTGIGDTLTHTHTHNKKNTQLKNVKTHLLREKCDILKDYACICYVCYTCLLTWCSSKVAYILYTECYTCKTCMDIVRVPFVCISPYSL